MPSILINGTEHPLPPGEKLNAIQAASRFGIDIPYYCWHPALSVVANCRMCEVEVGSKDAKTGEIKMLPKLVPACQTPAKDLTVVVTNSPKVKAHQRMIMEYLLINHPLDCPVCDQAGQCGLQDYSFEYGQSVHRFAEERIVNPRKDVSDRIQLNQDRCIMCTRCVRFTREITQTAELEVMNRGSHAEIDVFPGHPVDNPLAGNVVDLCPVGALLDKDFLHRQRFWFLSRHDSICPRCSTGCNIYSEENRGQIWRFRARTNPHVNDYWICDEGRYSYKAANNPALLNAMYVRRDGELRPAPIDRALAATHEGLEQICQSGGAVAGIVSPFLTVEEAFLLASYLKALSPANVLALAPIPTSGADITFQPDPHKGRTGDTTSGALEPAFDSALARTLRDGVDFLVVQDVHATPLAQAGDVVLAGAMFAERAGCYVNAQGRLQYSGAALPPREGSLPDLDLLAILRRRHAGPVHSRDVLAELAQTVPAFQVAQGGHLPTFGAILGEPPPAPGVNGQYVYREPWLTARFDKGDRPGEPTPKGAANA
jgi:NADH-quinone oxidoreductase subunit G